MLTSLVKNEDDYDDRVGGGCDENDTIHVIHDIHLPFS